jgi:D-alanyl-lipoteichoic acid acyltransferase DltB (MBOAT superfamily)
VTSVKTEEVQLQIVHVIMVLSMMVSTVYLVFLGVLIVKDLLITVLINVQKKDKISYQNVHVMMDIITIKVIVLNVPQNV